MKAPNNYELWQTIGTYYTNHILHRQFMNTQAPLQKEAWVYDELRHLHALWHIWQRDVFAQFRVWIVVLALLEFKRAKFQLWMLFIILDVLHKHIVTNKSQTDRWRRVYALPKHLMYFNAWTPCFLHRKNPAFFRTWIPLLFGRFRWGPSMGGHETCRVHFQRSDQKTIRGLALKRSGRVRERLGWLGIR